VEQASLREARDQYTHKLTALKTKYDLTAIKARAQIQAAIEEADLSSDALGSAFAQGEVPLVEFLDTFLKSRTQFHALGAKLTLCGR
jgi:hypothetical protein